MTGRPNAECILHAELGLINDSTCYCQQIYNNNAKPALFLLSPLTAEIM